MTALDEHKKLLKGIVAGLVPVQTIWATCTAVDGETMTAKELVHGVELFEVLLGLDIVRIPKKGAKCLIGIIQNSSSDAFMIWCDQVEELRLKGKEFTILKGAETLAELKKTNERLEATIGALQNWTPVPNDGGAALKTLITTAYVGKQKADYKSELENKTVKHG